MTAVEHGVDISSLLGYVYIALSIAQFEFTRNVAQGYRTRILCNINIASNGLADTVDCLNARVDGDITCQIAAEFNRFCLVYCCIARAGNKRIIYYFGCAGFVGDIEVSAVENNVNIVYRVGNIDVALGVIGCQFAAESAYVNRTGIVVYYDISSSRYRNIPNRCGGFRVGNIEIAAVERCFNFSCGTCNVNVALRIVGSQFAVECSDEVDRTRIRAYDSIALCAFRRAYFCTADSRVFGVDIAAVERCFNFGCGSCNIDVALCILCCQFAAESAYVNRTGIVVYYDISSSRYRNILNRCGGFRIGYIEIAAVERCVNRLCGLRNIDIFLGVVDCQYAVNGGNFNLAGVGING